MTGEEAEKSPAGLGREEPDPLEKPQWVKFLLHFYQIYYHDILNKNQEFKLQ